MLVGKPLEWPMSVFRRALAIGFLQFRERADWKICVLADKVHHRHSAAVVLSLLHQHSITAHYNR